MKHLNLIAAVGTAALLSVCVSTAAAGHLSTSSRTLRATFREVRLRLPFGVTNCLVTLEGTLHSSTIAKVAGTLMGYITRAAGPTCLSGSATILSETLPWHIQYESFTGTLPNILTIRTKVIGFAWRLREPNGVTCLLRSTAAEPVLLAYNREPGGALTGAELGGRIRVGSECLGATGEFTSDRAPVTVLNSTARISVTLI